MNVKDNPVVNTVGQAASLTLYFLALLTAWELSTWLYAKYSTEVKWQSKKLYYASAAKAKQAKNAVVGFGKKYTKA